MRERAGSVGRGPAAHAPLWSGPLALAPTRRRVCVTGRRMWVKLGGMPTLPISSQPRVSRALVRQRLLALALGGLQFAAMTVVGMLAVWALGVLTPGLLPSGLADNVLALP